MDLSPVSLPVRLSRRGVFYGWVIVFICFSVLCLNFGVRLSFGIFFEALTRDGEFGWSRGETAGVFSLSVLVQALTSAFVGWLLDRLGVRWVFVGGLLIIAGGLILTSRMTSLRDFYLFFGLCVGLGSSILGLSVHGTTISRWFGRGGRRGLAIGLAYAGTGIGILALAPILERIIAWFDWRTAYLALAGLGVALVLPTLLLLRDSPARFGLRPDGDLGDERHAANHEPRPAPPAWTFGQALRSPAFWLLMLAGVCSLFTLRMITVHQIAYLVDQGVPRLTAATVFGGAGLITALSYIGFGSLSDRIGRENAFGIGALAQLAALALLMGLNSSAPVGLLYLYALLWGIGEGSRSGLLTAIAGDSFAGRDMGTIIGMLGGFFGLGAAIGSWAGGLIFDWSGNYLPAFAMAFAATLLAVGCVFAARRLQPR